MQQLIITAVGPDRPGLVEQISRFLLEQGANVADSRMVNLRGQFAMMILAEAPDAVAQGIRDKAGAAGAVAGLNLQIAQAGTDPATGDAGLPYRLRIDTMDQPGIVHRVTAALHRHQVNIEELQTRLSAGSVSGTPLFSMEVTMTLPAALSADVLRTELGALCESLNCDLNLTAAQ